MRERGWQVTGFVGDVAEKQALEEFAALVLREHPEGIHCLINNACLMRGGILSDCEYEDFLYVQRVGVVAPYMLARLFKDHFQGMGAIVKFRLRVLFNRSRIRRAIRQPKEELLR